MPGTQEQKQAFLSSAHFAVVGASKDETKVGTKVCLHWSLCLQRELTTFYSAGAEMVR